MSTQVRRTRNRYVLELALSGCSLLTRNVQPVQAYVKDDRVIVIVGNVSEAMFVVQAQLAANKSYWKYQLEKADGTLHANGEWVAESKLVHG